MIITDPDTALELLEANDFPNLAEEERQKLIKNAKSSIKTNKKQFDDQIELAQFENVSIFLTKLANGEMGWKEVADIADAVRNGILPQKFGEAFTDVVAEQGEFIPRETANENYPRWIDQVYNAKDKGELQDALFNILKDNKNLSKDKLSVLINGAMQRGNTLPLSAKDVSLQTPEQQDIDNGARAVTNYGRRNDLSDNEISDMYQNYMTFIGEGKSSFQAIQLSTNNQVIQSNPSLKNIPETGKLMRDHQGIEAMVFPDGHFEEVKKSSGSKDKGKK